MSSPQQPENTQQPDTSGVGALLKASRLRIGEELSEVSDVLRIRNVYLEAIEENGFDRLPAVTFVRGYVREFSAFLDLDEDEVVEGYMERFHGAR